MAVTYFCALQRSLSNVHFGIRLFVSARSTNEGVHKGPQNLATPLQCLDFRTTWSFFNRLLLMPYSTRSHAVARIASQHLRGSRDVIVNVTIW